MKLKDALKFVRAGEKIRIGTETGSGYIYDGLKRGFNSAAVNRQLKESYIKKISSQMLQTRYGASELKRRALIRKVTEIVTQYLDASPLMEREVVDSYHGQIEAETKVFIVKGSEDGEQYNPNLPKLKPETIDTAAAVKLTGAIYKEPADKLTNDHRLLKKEQKKRKALEEERENLEGMLEITTDLLKEADSRQSENAVIIKKASDHSERMKALIEGLPYLSDEQNQGIIREARLAAERKD